MLSDIHSSYLIKYIEVIKRFGVPLYRSPTCGMLHKYLKVVIIIVTLSGIVSDFAS